MPLMPNVPWHQWVAMHPTPRQTNASLGIEHVPVESESRGEVARPTHAPPSRRCRSSPPTRPLSVSTTFGTAHTCV